MSPASPRVTHPREVPPALLPHRHTLVFGVISFPPGTPQEAFAQASLPLPTATSIYFN